MESDRESSTELERQITALDSQILAINVDKESNHSNRMREQAQRRIDELKRDIDGKNEDNKKLAFQVRCLMNYLNDLAKLEYRPVTRREAELLGKVSESDGGAAADGGKAQIVERLETFARKEQIELQEKGVLLKAEMKQVSDEIEECQGRLKNLEKRVLPYPEYARKLKELVEKEFARRGIRSTVYFLSELLEITDHTWNNAIEGYLNTQKFYLVVEPEYYVVALEVYDRNRKQIHTAGIINTRKIPTGHEPDQDSLAAVVKSENRYAKAYADYILGRVKRCADVHELEEHAIAMTPDCMLYQGYVVRHLNPRDYENPFIGQNAYRVQIGNVRRQIEEKVQKRSSLREQISIYDAVLESGRQVNLEVLRLYLNVPEVLRDLQDQLTVARIDLKEAESDPTLIELNIKLEGKEKERHDKRQQQKALEKEIVRLEEQIGSRQNAVKEKNREYEAIREALERKADEEGLAYREADEKYRQNRKSKQPGTIAENYAPRGQQLLNERERLLNGAEGLYGLQMRFNQEFAADFVTGLTGIPDYREALQKLKGVEIVRYEEKLMAAKEDCEQIFRSDFLSKMKENIEGAKNEFRSLNKALYSIYYGDDSYRFKITFDKRKEGLYKMITSENNQEGINLWTSAFEEEYREEMSDLFEKLMTKDDNGQKIVEEYTDYRSYLDYDIEIHKRDGSVQRFSDIYGEKSGSETQVPYYVAIAASFYQLYRYGNSVRIMLLDEAFDKMDDERIQSMMDFFNGLGLQVILATPPAKIEVIGEKVGTVLTAIRVGQSSIVEEYDL